MADRVLLTGISGFIAKHVAKRLLEEGYHVRGTVRTKAKGEQARETLASLRLDVSRLEIVEADLGADYGWNAAAEGCRYVQHTASPFPGVPPREKFALVPAARDGTLRVLNAAVLAGAERVVLTSSVVAIYHGHEGRADKRFTEADVSNVESPTISSYAVSKTLAERAAWEAAKAAALPLAVLNPAFVLGPALDRDIGTSLAVIASMMRGRLPIVPDAQFGIVDVRDVAEAHLRAMTGAEAVGQRFILSAGHRSLVQIGSAIGSVYPGLPRLPRRTIPTALIRWAGKVSRRVALLSHELDPDRTLDNTKAAGLLNLRFHSPEAAVEASARSLVDLGVVPAQRH